MNYDHEHLLADFAKRTRHNLQLIREVQASESEKQAFEVTQLINSMLGLLVFPKERYLDDLPDKTLDELRTEGWPIPEVHPSFTEPENLKRFLGYMRNAIAHFNLEFVPNEKNEIVGLKVWNEKKVGNRKVKTWEVRLTLEQMEEISLRFIDLLANKKEPNG